MMFINVSLYARYYFKAFFFFLRLCYLSFILWLYPCGRGVEYAHCFPTYHMRLLKECPDGSVSTAWDYTGILCNLYRDAGLKRCHYSQASRAQSALNPFYTWCNMLLTGLHHSPVVSNPILLLSNPSILPLHLRARELGVIIIMMLKLINLDLIKCIIFITSLVHTPCCRERLLSTRVQLRKPLSTIMLWYFKGFIRTLNLSSIMPRDASLLAAYTPDRHSFSCLATVLQVRQNSVRMRANICFSHVAKYCRISWWS